MTAFTLPYDNKQLVIELPDTYQVDQLLPLPGNVLENPEKSIAEAISSPIGDIDWQAVRGAKTVGIAINDKTRPVPKPNPVKHLLEHLEKLGYPSENITLFIGSGTHPPMTTAGLSRILHPTILDRYHVVVHDCDHSPMVDLGKTELGNPVQINADFYHCDLKISVGNIEPHHFMGFSGGVKTAAIGLASRRTIAANHINLTHPQARTGVYHKNPLRQEVEAIGQKAGVHFSLGTILDEEKHILNIFFGEPIEVMAAAMPIVRRLFGVSVPKLYDVVIASPGGAPKDINLYQSQKALTHAARITRDGGWVILLAACPEGSGSQAYEDYITQAESHQSIIDHFSRGYFKVGPHKALQIATEAIRVNIVLVSDLPPQTVKNWKLNPGQPENVNSVIGSILPKVPDKARVAILPAATRTMTEIKK